MSEQVLADYIEKALIENNLHCIRDEELKKYIKYINNWNELKERIDEAIEYMNSEEFFMLMNTDINSCNNYFRAKGNLLDILQGNRK